MRHKTTLVIILLTLTATILTPISTAAVYAQKKELSITVICLEFPDALHYASNETIRRTAIEQVNKFYQEVSYGQLSVVGQLYGWYMMPAPCSKFDVFRWDSPSEARMRLLQVAQSVAEKNGVNTVGYVFLVFSASVWGFASNIGPGISVQSESDSWMTYAHELGHLLGLPDLYHYGGQRYGYPIDFVGSWDLMGSGATMCAWSRVKAGWISTSQIVKVGLDKSAMISPLEQGKGLLAARVETTASAVQYLMVEVRLGKGILITEIDETKLSGEGIVRVVDARPETSTLDDACFYLSAQDVKARSPYFAVPDPIPVYINPSHTLAIVILDKIQDSYRITLTRAENGQKALEAHKAIGLASSAIEKARNEIRLEGLQLANTTLYQAIAQYQQGRFTDACLVAATAKTLAETATIPRIYYEAKEGIETAAKRFDEGLLRELTSSQARSKRNEAATALNDAKKAFTAHEFELALTRLKKCNDLQSEAEQIENARRQAEAERNLQTGVIAAISLSVVVSIILLRRRRRRPTSPPHPTEARPDEAHRKINPIPRNTAIATEL